MNRKGKTYSNIIKQGAKRLGFLSCGISKAEFLETEAPKLEQWLQEGRHGSMSWMERNFDKRLDPTLLVPGAKSVVSLLLNYYPHQEQNISEGVPKISRYAYGKDYHFVIKDKLKELLHVIETQIGAVEGRAFVDSAPVMDKAWAAKSGLGWQGKNTNLISIKTGSYFFVAELILDLELEYDVPVTDHCGSCTTCIDACPTEALTPYEIDASKCISYLTIELRDEIPEDFRTKMENWAFGCDICQEICPWNRFSKPHTEEAFESQTEWMEWSKADWEELTEEVFKTAFKDSAIKRTKYEGLKRNLTFLK